MSVRYPKEIPVAEISKDPTLRVLSLGGGVQSTVMCLLAEQGDFGVKPDCAIFADTRWEPNAVYGNIEWLRSQVSFPVITTDNGRSLKDDLINGVNATDHPFLTIPVYLAGGNGKPDAIARRQCTSNYKIVPIQKKVRELIGLRPRQRFPKNTTVEMWLGISLDEIARVKTSREWWIENRYPLIDDVPMTRSQCVQWFEERYPGRELSRSACAGCPFRNSSDWLEIKRTDPELYEEAVAIDAMIRSETHYSGQRFEGSAYLHHRRIPLDDALSMDIEQREVNGFINECEGHCGV